MYRVIGDLSHYLGAKPGRDVNYLYSNFLYLRLASPLLAHEAAGAPVMHDIGF